MHPSPARDPRAPRGILLVGPGPRAAVLARVLGALGTTHGVEARSFADIAELALESGRAGILVLDLDSTPIEDVGYVRRFLAAHTGFQIVLLGVDSRTRTARVLGTQRFMHWPPDIEELGQLVAGVRTNAGLSTATPSSIQVPPRAAPVATRTAPDDELELVRTILERESANDAGLPREPIEDDGEVAEDAAFERREFADVFGEDLDELVTAAVTHELNDMNTDAARARATPDTTAIFDQADDELPTPALGLDIPPWWRAQVADLADAAQRIDLSVRVLARAAPQIDSADHEEAQKRLRELEAEVARLLQFTRTLGYVAAPPPAGTQVFDLGEMVHLFAANLAASGGDAPRCQFKTTPGADVRSDRLLLNQALDAVFFLVRCTSKKGDLVRAQVQRSDEDGRAWVELALDFPSGPLEGFPEDELVAPYGLADLFPDLGPNALAAARGIVAGQGGRLSLASRARGRMTWRLRLPRPLQ